MGGVIPARLDESAMELPMNFCVISMNLAVLVLASDPNRLPQDETRGYARLCVEWANGLSDLPIKTDADPDRACAVRGEGGGAMVIPDSKLTADRLAGAGKDVIPLGQLWLRKWTPVLNGKPTPNDDLRIVAVTVDDKDRPMPLLLLGVRQGDKGLELLAYARNREPMVVLPLKKMEVGEELPLGLEWKRGDKAADTLTLTVLGKYQAVLAIGPQVQ
jgi:hypothetical protein